MTSDENRKVWLRDTELAWVKATVLNEGEPGKVPRVITVQSIFGNDPVTVEVDPETGEKEGEVKALNLFEEDSDIRGYEGVQDLTTLTHLHEAEILEALCVRFQSDQIYTFTGPILLAVNPFKELSIYTKDILGNYYSAGLLKMDAGDSPKLPPHVFAIADAAYRQLRDKSATVTMRDQSILVSGESGAGKTESTKYVMRYLATVAKKEKEDSSDKSRAERVLESNPILESFGNARTNRNDNSSRFGKFIQMSFDDGEGDLVGAQIKTYLLEKVRLTKQGAGERNFHVFYQMCAGASETDREKWKLPQLETSLYTNQSDIYDRRDGVLDADQFARTDEALSKMRLSEDRDDIYKIASAVMNTGNIEFDGPQEGPSAVLGGLESIPLKTVAELLAVDPDLLIKALTTKKLVIENKPIIKPLTPEESCVVRDALAKTVYSRLFDWIVKKVNAAIATDSAGSSTSKKKLSFIGVLDIFGFEVFKHNSFEQLCINYANETLQQQFNEFVFQLEQKLYESERITWKFIDFPDNKPVLDLIEEKKPKPGILALLDEQCMIKGNDEAFANMLYKTLGTTPTSLLFASAADKRNFDFCVRHYAGDVTYSSRGFCAKNKDELREEVLDTMRTSKEKLVLALFPETSAKNEQTKGSIMSETVGSQFKGQLAELLKTIKATSPHYIRCLKPNDQNIRDTLVRPRIVDQLRYGGVLEAVKVARAGYPTRFLLRDFVRRYFMISGNLQTAMAKRAQNFAPEDERWVESCLSIVNGPEKLEKENQYQIGRTKVFLRKSAYEKLESARAKVLKSHAVEIQKVARGSLKRKSYLSTLKSVHIIQRIIRGFIGRRRARNIRRANAAVKIQKVVRQFVKRFQFLRLRTATICAQKIVRGRAGRIKAKNHRIFVSARAIQCFFRKSKARKQYLLQRNAAIVLQTAIRGKLARNALKVLRMERSNVNFLKDKITELQKKVVELEGELEIERSRGSKVVEVVKNSAKEQELHAAPERLNEEEPPMKKSAAALGSGEIDSIKEQHDAEISKLRKTIEEQAIALNLAKSGNVEVISNIDNETPSERDQEKFQVLQAEMNAQKRKVEMMNEQLKEEQTQLEVLKHQLEAKNAEISQLTLDRDTLVKGTENDLLAQAIRERDEAKTGLEQLRIEFSDLQQNVPQQTTTQSSSETGEESVDSLTRKTEALSQAYEKEKKSNEDHSASFSQQLAHLAAELEMEKKKSDFLKLNLTKALEEKELAEKQSESFQQLLYSSEQDGTVDVAILQHEKLWRSQKAEMDEVIVKITKEKVLLEEQLIKEKEEVLRVLAERDSLVSYQNAPSDDERVQVLLEREKILQQERDRLANELEEVKMERETLKDVLSREDTESLDLKIAQNTITELILERDVVAGGKEKLEEENNRLKHEVQELMVKEKELRIIIDSLPGKANAGSLRDKLFGHRNVNVPASAPGSPLASIDTSKLPNRGDILQSRVQTLEAELGELKKEKEQMTLKILEARNESNNRDVEVRKQKRLIADLNEKIDAMSLLAEQTSAIKIKLARRLDGLINENTTMKQTVAELSDQLAAMQDVSRVLNDELLKRQEINESILNNTNGH